MNFYFMPTSKHRQVR